MCVLHCTLIYARKQGQNLTNEHCYDNVPKLVQTSHEGKVIVLWNLQLQTDRTIPNNKPDSIISDNEKGTCVLIDGTI